MLLSGEEVANAWRALRGNTPKRALLKRGGEGGGPHRSGILLASAVEVKGEKEEDSVGKEVG